MTTIVINRSFEAVGRAGALKIGRAADGIHR